MNSINAEYTIKVKIGEMLLSPNESRQTVEARIKEIATSRIQALLSGRMYDPQGKVFEESFKIEPKQ
jgi:hypothetical protein